jgi:hypothetical protein
VKHRSIEFQNIAQAMIPKGLSVALGGVAPLKLHMSITLFIVSLASVFAVAALPSPDVCGWPSLREGGRFGPSTVRLAQRLLSNVLNKTIPVDGNFSSELIADIKDFQEMHSLNATGILNADAWPTLINLCTPLEQVAQRAHPELRRTFSNFWAGCFGHFGASASRFAHIQWVPDRHHRTF